MIKTNKEYAKVIKNQLAYATERNPLYPLNVDINELWAALYRSIDILESKDEDILPVIRCKDCGYFNSEKWYCNRPCESIVCRNPDDFCSKASRRNKLI